MLGDCHVQDTWAECEAAGGLSGQTLLATPFGMTPAGRLRAGDQLRSVRGGPVYVVATRPAPNLGWMRIPPLALGNRHAVIVAQGQNIGVESSLVARMLGSMAVALPAAALRHWRGIAPCAAPMDTVRLTLSRPTLMFGSDGILFAANGPANFAMHTADLPPVPSLSLASARQLAACLIAQDAGAMLRSVAV